MKLVSQDQVKQSHSLCHLWAIGRSGRELYYGSTILNSIRRKWHSASVALQSRLYRAPRHVRLHLGCGSRHLPGYVNVDWRKTRATDRVLDIRHLPYASGSVSLIETYHVIEHLSLADASASLRNWFDILVPGGRLIVECPDFDAVCRAYLDGQEVLLQLYYIFGRQRFPGDVHHWGFNFVRLAALLADVGFIEIQRYEPQDYHQDEAACLRIECIKPLFAQI